MKNDELHMLGLPLVRFHRWAAVIFGAALAAFGAWGLAASLPFLGPGGTAAGLGTNGLLSLVSVVVGAALAVAATRGGAAASTTMLVVGILFLGSGLVNLVLLGTSMNLLGFRGANVVFSIVAGFALLMAGAYGRFSGGLAVDNPFVLARARRASGRVPELGRNGGDAREPSLEEQAQPTLTELIAAETAHFLGRATAAQRAALRGAAQIRAEDHYRQCEQRFLQRALI